MGMSLALGPIESANLAADSLLKHPGIQESCSKVDTSGNSALVIKEGKIDPSVANLGKVGGFYLSDIQTMPLFQVLQHLFERRRAGLAQQFIDHHLGGRHHGSSSLHAVQAQLPIQFGAGTYGVCGN